MMIDLGGLESLIGGLLGDVHFSLKVNNYKFTHLKYRKFSPASLSWELFIFHLH